MTESASPETHAFETLGIAPVPARERKMRPGSLFVIWGLASASATTPVIGLVLKGVGLSDFVWLNLLALLVGLVPSMLLAHMGRQVPIISMVMARRTYGLGGATLLAALYTIVGAGWFGLNTDVGGQILGAIFPGYGIMWYVILGVVQIALVFFGMEVLQKFYNYTALVFLLCYAVLGYYLFTRYPFAIPVDQGVVDWGKDIDLILSFSLLAWAYIFPTVTRFCTPISSTEKPLSRALYMLAPSVGVMAAVLVMGALGLVALQMTGDWNIAMLGKSLPVWGEISAIGVILAIAHCNAMNLYPAVTSLLAVINVAGERSHRMLQPSLVIVLGIFSTVLAILGILDFIQGFLSLLGSLLFPFSFILVVDWFHGRYHAEPVSLFYRKVAGLAECFSWPAPWAIAMLILGVFLGQSRWLLPTSIGHFIPWQVCSAAIVTIIYYCGLRVAEQRIQLRKIA
ncbi:MAG TPA: cytosine permease [Steroidobacteraceae bacterium]|jgi:purine-cytosine permease-like protein|nr:cytosine permease [Steroidobacteraceae bacterium]